MCSIYRIYFLYCITCHIEFLFYFTVITSIFYFIYYMFVSVTCLLNLPMPNIQTPQL